MLVFRSDFSRVKLCDFGESKRVNQLVQRRNEWLPYTAPEIICTETDDTYKTDFTHDIWQFGIVLFICLTGMLFALIACAHNKLTFIFVSRMFTMAKSITRRSPL